MGANAMQLLEECIERLKQDRLTEAHLRDLGSVIMTDTPKTAALTVSANRYYRSDF